MKEILRVDKPKGISSFDVIRILRRELGIKKVGHAGTLDPLASGLLLVGVGKGTKKLQSLLKLPKTYEVEILVGEKRTTGDMEGEVVQKEVVKYLDNFEVEKVFKKMEGSLELPVPMYSAIKVDGERLYKKARRGEVFAAPTKTMVLKSVKVKKVRKEFDHYSVFVKMEVGSGAYIRSIVEAFGDRIGHPCTTKNLRRTKIGKYGLLFAKKIKAKKEAGH